MTKSRPKKELTIESISYVNDPEASRKWFEIYVDIVKKALLEEASKKND